MSGPAVPRRVREITPEWLTDVLAAGGRLEDARVADVDVENISAGVGFAGRALRLDITYDPSDTPLPGSLILKLPSPDPGMREMMNALRGYELEGRFYEQLAEQTPLRVPVCYWSAVDVEGGDYALLLEHLDGLRTGDQQASCTESEAEAIVRALATMHAAWWDSQELRRHDWLPAFDETGAVWQERSRVGLQPFLDQHGGWLPDGFDSTNERIVERLIELQGGVDGSPQTLVHGDFRLENMMFGEPRSDDDSSSSTGNCSALARGRTTLPTSWDRASPSRCGALGKKIYSGSTSIRSWVRASTVISPSGFRPTTGGAYSPR